MARQATGAITITDVADGTSPISAFLSNQNHTFPASTDGAIVSGDVDNYSTAVRVFIGSTEAAFNNTATTDAAMANSTYRIALNSGNNTNGAVVVGSGWPTGNTWPVSTTGTPVHAVVTGPATAVSNTSADSALLTINLRVKNSLGTISLLSLEVTFNKAIAGSGGDIVQLDANKQFFTADSAGTFAPAAQDDVIVNIYTQGSPGAQQYYISQAGAGFVQRTTAANTIGNIKGFDTNRSGAFTTTGTISTSAQRLTLSTANMGTNASFTLKVTGSTDSKGNDVVSFVKVQTGAAGAASLTVVIESSTTTTFSSGDQADKTLTARVYDAGTGSEITSNLTYSWKLGDTAANNVKIDNTTDRNVSNTGVDATTQTIIVGATDVTNSQQYSCVIQAS